MTWFTEDMAGKPICDNCVAIPQNHKWSNKYFGEEDIRTQSSAKCPTYGTCIYCFGSGPVGMNCQNPHCNNWRKEDNQYLRVYYGHGDHKTLDSQWISHLVESHHEVEIGDQIND